MKWGEFVRFLCRSYATVCSRPCQGRRSRPDFLCARTKFHLSERIVKYFQGHMQFHDFKSILSSGRRMRATATKSRLCCIIYMDTRKKRSYRARAVLFYFDFSPSSQEKTGDLPWDGTARRCPLSKTMDYLVRCPDFELSWPSAPSVYKCPESSRCVPNYQQHNRFLLKQKESTRARSFITRPTRGLLMGEYHREGRGGMSKSVSGWIKNARKPASQKYFNVTHQRAPRRKDAFDVRASSLAKDERSDNGIWFLD